MAHTLPPNYFFFLRGKPPFCLQNHSTLELPPITTTSQNISLLLLIRLSSDVNRPQVIVQLLGDTLCRLQQLWYGDDALDLGALELPMKLVDGEQRIGEGDDEAGLQARVHRHQVLGHVGQQETYPVAGLQTGVGQEGLGTATAEGLAHGEGVRAA